MPTSPTRKSVPVILIPSLPSATPASAPATTTTPTNASTAVLPDIVLTPTADFDLSFFASNSPSVNPPSLTHTFATTLITGNRQNVNASFDSSGTVGSHKQSSGSESSSPVSHRPSFRDTTAKNPAAHQGAVADAGPPQQRQNVSPFGSNGPRASDGGVAEPRSRKVSAGSVGRGVRPARAGSADGQSQVVGGRLLAKDAKASGRVDEADDEVESDRELHGKKRGPRKESLAELLSSAPSSQYGESAAARPPSAKQPVAAVTPPSPPVSSVAFPTAKRADSFSRMSKRTAANSGGSSSASSPAHTPPVAPSATFAGTPLSQRQTARSPRIDEDDAVELGSDGEGNGEKTPLKRRASPAAELAAFFNETAPPPSQQQQQTQEVTQTSPARNQSSPTPYLRLSPSASAKRDPFDKQPADRAAPNGLPIAQQQQNHHQRQQHHKKGGLKSVFSKAFGKSADSHTSSSAGGFDRSMISQPMAVPAGTAELMRTRSASSLDPPNHAAAAQLNQPTTDLRDRSTTVAFPSAEPTSVSRASPAVVQPFPQPPLATPRPRTKSALSQSDKTPTSQSNRNLRIDNGESYFPRDDDPIRPAAAAAAPIPRSATTGSVPNAPAFVRGAPGVIPWLANENTGGRGAPLNGVPDRLRTPTPGRSMSISRKPVSPELRNAVDLPPVDAAPAPKDAPAPVSPTRSQVPLASRLAEVVARTASPPIKPQPLPAIVSPALPTIQAPVPPDVHEPPVAGKREDSSRLTHSPPRTAVFPEDARPEVSPVSTIVTKEDVQPFPVPPMTGTDSPSRSAKLLASARAHAAMAPPVPALGASPAPEQFVMASPLSMFGSPFRMDAPSTGMATPERSISPVDKPEEDEAPVPRSSPAPATEDEEPVTPRASIIKEDALKILSPPAAPIAIPAVEADETLLPLAIAPMAAVPVSELVYLRSLLANATTADECRLLVGMLLSLWGVSSDESQSSEQQHFTRVCTWLLSDAGVPAPTAGAGKSLNKPTRIESSSATELPPRALTPSTPRVIPPTPVHSSEGGPFAPASPTTSTIDESQSEYSANGTAEDVENAKYEVRVVAGRAAIVKALHNSPDRPPNGQYA